MNNAVICDEATGRILSYHKWNAPEPEAGQVAIPVDSPPDIESLRWDGADGLRELTQREHEIIAQKKRDAAKAKALAVVSNEDDPIVIVLEKLSVILQRELRAIKGNNPRDSKSLNKLKAELGNAIANDEKE